jgi:hypothetical protein
LFLIDLFNMNWWGCEEGWHAEHKISDVGTLLHLLPPCSRPREREKKEEKIRGKRKKKEKRNRKGPVEKLGSSVSRTTRSAEDGKDVPLSFPSAFPYY